ncbi:CU044_2847 family protein [Streptomyces bicolor]|uniref:CU044_2847 family protein n=1 Tax=Streptomyces bicolor TaxID=66874 RepID=UPI000690F9A8|nr:CU044_2847 family protein [Streptomyces bicolor]
MPDAVQFTLSDGTVVLVAPPARAGTGAVGLGTRLESAAQSLRDALAPVTAAASDVIGGFRSLAQRPDEVEVTFGVVLDAKLGAVLSSASAGAHLDVTLRWNGTDAAPDAGDAAPAARP